MCDQAEQALLQRARAGDRPAFDQLQRLLQKRARLFIRRLIGPSPLEEDIARDVFLALFMNLGKLDSVERLRPFLYRVARNRCYSELRRLGRFRVVSLDDPPGDLEGTYRSLPDTRTSPDEQVQWTLLYAAVQRALERLPELQRQTMILYGLEDLTYAQIAEAMDTDIGTVKSRIHYARKTLTRLLGPDTAQAIGLPPH